MDTNAERAMAFPAFAMEASARKCWGKKGVMNSQPMVASKMTEVVKRMRCTSGGNRGGVTGIHGEERGDSRWESEDLHYATLKEGSLST